MTITKEISLKDFDFWAGAVNTASLLTDDEFDTIEAELEDSGESWSETAINDLFWFESDYVAQALGFEDWEELYKQRKG